MINKTVHIHLKDSKIIYDTKRTSALAAKKSR